MARLNLVTLVGTVVEESLEVQGILIDQASHGLNQTDVSDLKVLNFSIKCKTKNTYQTIPVAVWDTMLIQQCMRYLNKGEMVYVQGELRYKYVFNKETRQFDKIYTNVKAGTVEFISKKLKSKSHEHESNLMPTINYELNEVKLIGNLVEDPKLEESFVLAVDRLGFQKEGDKRQKDYQFTDYVHLMVKDPAILRQKLTKSAMVIVDGSLMTQPKKEDQVTPRIVVDVKAIVGR